MAVVEFYVCDECGARSNQGPDDGLPDDWAENMDGDAFCAACLIRRPLDAHECSDDMCCYGATAPRAAAATPEVGRVTTRIVPMRCHCGRRVTIGPDPWCEGCVQSAATCDCVPVVEVCAAATPEGPSLYERVRAAYLPANRGTGCKGCAAFDTQHVSLLEFAGWMHMPGCTALGGTTIPEREAAVRAAAATGGDDE